MSRISVPQILTLGLRLLRIFEKIHEAGYAFNDLKLDNIMVGRGEVDAPREDVDFDKLSLHLIDFGCATKFLNNDGSHMEQLSERPFRGNLIFTSVDSMSFKSTSRRDDLISLGYLLTYLLRGKNLPGITLNKNDFNIIDRYHAILQNKINYSIHDLCSGGAEPLFDFICEVNALSHSQAPRYDVLE